MTDMTTRIAEATAYRDEMAALFHAATDALRAAEDVAMAAARAQDDTPALVVACEVAQKTADGARAIWDEYRVALDQAEGALADLQDEASGAVAEERLRHAQGEMRRAEELLGSARERRDTQVRAALAGGVSAATIAGLTGLSQPRVRQIRDGKR